MKVLKYFHCIFVGFYVFSLYSLVLEINISRNASQKINKKLSPVLQTLWEMIVFLSVLSNKRTVNVSYQTTLLKTCRVIGQGKCC